MSGDFVETVRIQSSGCVRDATLELTRLHALIGPNDSGKSTVRAALRTTGDLIQHGEQELARGERLDPRGVTGSRITMRWGAAELAASRDKGFGNGGPAEHPRSEPRHREDRDDSPATAAHPEAPNAVAAHASWPQPPPRGT